MESIENNDANRDELIIQQQREIEKEVGTAIVVTKLTIINYFCI